MSTTRVSRIVRVPRPVVYRVLLHLSTVTKWMVPSGMTGQVDEFDAREGGRIRVSLD